jgi:hypothetical protein
MVPQHFHGIRKDVIRYGLCSERNSSMAFGFSLFIKMHWLDQWDSQDILPLVLLPVSIVRGSERRPDTLIFNTAWIDRGRIHADKMSRLQVPLHSLLRSMPDLAKSTRKKGGMEDMIE